MCIDHDRSLPAVESQGHTGQGQELGLSH